MRRRPLLRVTRSDRDEQSTLGFVHVEATAIDPAARTVTTTSGRYYYDYLVSATGYRNRFDVVTPQLRRPLHNGPVARHSASQAFSRRRSRTRRASAFDSSRSRIATMLAMMAAMHTSPTISW